MKLQLNKKVVVVLLCNSIFLGACNHQSNDEKISIKNRIDSVEKNLYRMAADAPVDAKAGEAAVNAYIAYAEKFPTDSLSPEYLFKAGEVASAIKMAKPAVSYFNKLSMQYPEHPKAATALFLEAFILENQLGNYGKAAEIYNDVIRKYPNTTFARDAAACIQNLGKSPEELIKEFEKKNAK